MRTLVQVEIDGKDFELNAEVIDKKVWFKHLGEVYAYDVADLSDSGFKRTKSQVKSPDKITAPMPGKITKIFVSENQSVVRGDALLVMEAMKMEYTLKSDIAAGVEKLQVKLGDQVVLGQLLVQLRELK